MLAFEPTDYKSVLAVIKQEIEKGKAQDARKFGKLVRKMRNCDFVCKVESPFGYMLKARVALAR